MEASPGDFSVVVVVLDPLSFDVFDVFSGGGDGEYLLEEDDFLLFFVRGGSDSSTPLLARSESTERWRLFFLDLFRERLWESESLSSEVSDMSEYLFEDLPFFRPPPLLLL